jgi:hypothetical protein
MNVQLWRYEVRRIGWIALLMPPLALVVLSLFAVLASRLGLGSQVDRILSSGLDVLPMIGAVTVATLVANDPAIELHLTLPVVYRTTALRRVVLILGWTGLVAFAYTFALAVTGHLVWPVSLLGDHFIWLVPLLWLATVGMVLSLGLRAVAAGSGVIGVVWVFELFFARALAETPGVQLIGLFVRFDPVQPGTWLMNRVVLGVIAILLLGLTFQLLGQPEHLVEGGHG